jgi:transcriptional regulator with XRE-family HTH domain
MGTLFEKLWNKLAGSKKYREQFVAAQAKRALPFQIRALMKKKGWSQEKLATESGLTQGVISRAADPNYGNLTINTIVRIAGGLDVAYLGLLVPFSDLAKWFSTLSEESVQVLSFDEENERFEGALSSSDQAAGPGDFEPEKLNEADSWHPYGEYKPSTKKGSSVLDVLGKPLVQ